MNEDDVVLIFGDGVTPVPRGTIATGYGPDRMLVSRRIALAMVAIAAGSVVPEDDAYRITRCRAEIEPVLPNLGPRRKRKGRGRHKTRRWP